MNAVERVKQVCKERKIPLAHVERACGFANGYLSGLRKGTIPFDRIEKIADYLAVTADWILRGDEVPAFEGTMITKDEHELVVLYRSAPELLRDAAKRLLAYRKGIEENTEAAPPDESE